MVDTWKKPPTGLSADRGVALDPAETPPAALHGDAEQVAEVAVPNQVERFQVLDQEAARLVAGGVGHAHEQPSALLHVGAQVSVLRLVHRVPAQQQQ